MRSRLLAIVLGVGVALSSFCTSGCASLLGDFTASDEASDGGIDAAASDANETVDGTVNGGDANGASDGTVSDTMPDTNSVDSPPTGDGPPSNDANDDGAPLTCPGEKDCSGTCRSTSDPLFGCDDPACAPCQLNHATAACTSGACSIASCTPGYNDCNGSASDGCETLGKCPCTPENCAGCCDNSGNCQTSGMSTCGINGAQCNTCVTGQICNSGGGCDCDPACSTCCSNHICVAESDTTCGVGGNCTSCASGTTCQAAGTTYQCECTPTSCKTGCCANNPTGGVQATTCTTTELPGACGLHGVSCVTCGTDVGCDGTTGQCKCTAALCAGGCCTTDTSGDPECLTQVEQSVGACGNGGNACAPCTAANTCSSGSCSCPATATTCNGVCTDLQTNAQNCGTCGHSCVDETCAGGQCVQVTLGTAPTPDGGPSPSAEGLVVTPNAVYFTITEGGTSQGTVQTIKLPPVAGCGTNCSTVVVGGLTYPTGIVLGTSATQTMYIGASGSGTIVMELNGMTSTIASNAGPAGYGTGLVADSSNVYYGNTGSGVTACPLGSNCSGTTTTGTPVSTGYLAAYMAVDDGKALYFSDFGAHVYRCTLPSCVVTGLTVLVSNANEATFLYADATSLFWIDRGASITSGTISRMNKSTGAPITTYATNIDYGQGIVADATHVYWGQQDGVYSCPIAGCPTSGPTKIGTAETTDDIAQDSQFVYWVDYGGNVYRVAK